MAPSVLLIAYHFPPVAVSSGMQRTLSLARYLPQLGWRPVVLTVSTGAYEETRDDQLQDIPSEVVVSRAFALDAARHLAIRGQYWSRLAIPDRWASWWLAAVVQGLRLIEKYRIDAIWSTYPIATAHRIAATLARRSGRPWVADFRDPMVEFDERTGQHFPPDPKLRRARLDIERLVMERATCSVFCTEGARLICLARYPNVARDKLLVIPNGYDEEAFREAESLVSSPLDGRVVLLHSGTIYPGMDRDPSALFRVLRAMLRDGSISPGDFELRLRATGHDEHFRRLAAEEGVQEIVQTMPGLPYREALAEMMQAQGLLLLQGETSNPAVPAKLYEYLRAKRPIVPLVDSRGETAATLRAVGLNPGCALNDEHAIDCTLRSWLSVVRSGTTRLPDEALVKGYARSAQAARVASVFKAVAGL